MEEGIFRARGEWAEEYSAAQAPAKGVARRLPSEYIQTHGRLSRLYAGVPPLYWNQS